MSDAELAGIAAGDGFSVMLRRNLVTGATTLFRRELLAVAMPVPAGWIHDEWLGIVAAATRAAPPSSPRPLTRYRQHGANQIGGPAADGAPSIRQTRGAGVPSATRTLLIRAESLVSRPREAG